jgi:hypothetical protein
VWFRSFYQEISGSAPNFIPFSRQFQSSILCFFLSWYDSYDMSPADRGRVVKADIPCSRGGGRRGFDPRQLRRTTCLLSAVGDLKWSLDPWFIWIQCNSPILMLLELFMLFISWSAHMCHRQTNCDWNPHQPHWGASMRYMQLLHRARRLPNSPLV